MSRNILLVYSVKDWNGNIYKMIEDIGRIVKISLFYTKKTYNDKIISYYKKKESTNVIIFTIIEETN